MALFIQRTVRLRRKPGQRSNLSQSKIVAAALDVLDATGLRGFQRAPGRQEARVTPAAVFAHFEGGLAGLKAAMVNATLRGVAAARWPNDSPAGYVRGLFLSLLKTIHGKQPLAQLIAIEHSMDCLVCPIFVERVLSVALGSGKVVSNPARALDLVLAMLLGMIMVEGEIHTAGKSAASSRKFSEPSESLSLE